MKNKAEVALFILIATGHLMNSAGNYPKKTIIGWQMVRSFLDQIKRNEIVF